MVRLSLGYVAIDHANTGVIPGVSEKAPSTDTVFTDSEKTTLMGAAGRTPVAPAAGVVLRTNGGRLSMEKSASDMSQPVRAVGSVTHTSTRAVSVLTVGTRQKYRFGFGVPACDGTIVVHVAQLLTE